MYSCSVVLCFSPIANNDLISGLIVKNTQIQYKLHSPFIHEINENEMYVTHETSEIRPAIKLNTTETIYGIKLTNSWSTD